MPRVSVHHSATAEEASPSADGAHGPAPAEERAGSQPMALLMRAAIAHYSEQIQASERVVRESEDPEGVHDMRVATRGLRAALDVFVEVSVLDPSIGRKVRQRLRRLARALGRVRDLDVTAQSSSEYMAAHTGTSEALAGWMRRLERRHREARTRLLRRLDDQDYARLMRTLRRLGEEGRGEDAETSGGLLLPRYCAGGAIWRRYEGVLGCGGQGQQKPDSVAPEALHELRIACKRLRYVVELFAETIGPESDTVRQTVVHSQKSLGAAHDVATRLAALRRYSRKHADTVALREYISEETKQLETLQREAAGIRDELDGEPFRRAVADAIAAL